MPVDIPGYENIYKIDKEGIIYSKRGVKKSHIRGSGYKMVSLYNNGKRKNFTVHQLVAITFLNHKPCGFELVVNHIDRNKANNKLSNLELVTQRENTSKNKNNKTSKYTGVSVIKSTNKWYASIKIKGKTLNLGVYDNEYCAYLAYKNKLKTI